MNIIKRNTWVRIHKIVLEPVERSSNIPEDTKEVPLEMWLKGYLVEDAQLGDEVEIRTITGRFERGRLIEVFPSFQHNYGEYVKELTEIDEQVKNIVFGDEDEQKQ